MRQHVLANGAVLRLVPPSPPRPRDVVAEFIADWWRGYHDMIAQEHRGGW